MSSKGWGVRLPIKMFKALRWFKFDRQFVFNHIHPRLKPWAIENPEKIKSCKMWNEINIGAGFLTGVMEDLIGFKSNSASR